MLIVHKVGPSVASYYLDGRDPGRWTPAAGRLLGLSGAVSSTDLVAVLRGRDPGDGRFLPRFRAQRRRSGWDLVFSAPKSVSLLGLAGQPGSGSAADAHMAAVGGIIELLERRMATTGAAGLIGARFEHRSNAAGEPHLHTHVLVANLTVGARGWSAVRSDDWFVDRRSLDALYQLSLRRELAARGWQLEWRLHPDGRGDVAAVPSAAVRAASTQRQLVAAVGPFEARRQAVAQPWEERVSAAGWGQAPPAGWRPGRGTGGSSTALSAPEVATRVTNHLAARRSDFREADVIVALAATFPAGAGPEEATSWAVRFCSDSLASPSPTARPRWTTALARSADDRLTRLLEELHGRAPGPGRAPGWGGPVAVLGSPPGRTSLMAQAELLHGLRREWARAGLDARVAATTDLAALRWQVLTGLQPYRSGARADVLVVDQADRRSTAELLQLAGAARRHGADLVLVEGGTLPRLTNPASHGLARFAAESGRIQCPTPQVWGIQCGRTRGLDGGPLEGREAAGDLLARWAAGGRADLLVGLGLEEVRSLNAGARAITSGAGDTGRGRGWVAGAGGFVPGDRVVVVRSGEGRPRYGTFGDVVGAGGASPATGRVAIRWDGTQRVQDCGPDVLAGIGHGWAVTTHLAGRTGRSLMVLGPAAATGRLRPRVRASIELVGPDDGRRLGMTR